MLIEQKDNRERIYGRAIVLRPFSVAARYQKAKTLKTC